MINALLGRPRSGKSYESVVFHIIPAIESGRKVITNIPLNLEWFKQVYGGGVLELIEVREYNFADYGKKRPFSSPSEYMDKWRNEKGQGPLYVIDECHLSLPRGRTPVEVVEWYSMHGHYGVDILLLTQSIGKVDKDIKEMIQLCYYTSKNTALGSEKSYTKKVKDGYRGEVLNTEIRRYKPAYFKFYQSHTQSKQAVSEASAQDVKPIWAHWTFRGSALFIAVGISMAVYMLFKDDEKPVVKKQKSEVIKIENKTPSKVIATAEKAKSPPEEKEEKKELEHPYADTELFISAYLESEEKRKNLFLFSVAQNGQFVYQLTSKDLENAGYRFLVHNRCLVQLLYFGKDAGFVKCGSPQQSLAPRLSTR